MQSIPAKIPRTTNHATIPELDLSIVTSKNNKAYQTYHFLDPKSLASMQVVNTHFRNMLGADINFNKKIQCAKFLTFAKKATDQIEDGYEKSTAYCAIATVQAKTNSVDANQTFRLAKQTADQIEYDDEKSIAYCAIATEQAKTNPVVAKQTADQIQHVYLKSKAYCAIAAAFLP